MVDTVGEEGREMDATKSSVNQEVWQVVQRLNRAWVEGRPADLAKWFHEDMVIVAPDLRTRFEGREACIRSYAEFLDRGVVDRFEEIEPHVDVFGDAAVATYRFDVTYEMGGQTLRDRGGDLFVLRRENGGWKAVWRTMLLDSPEQGGGGNAT
jgi:ketosteroid isomerase-like protein